MRLSSFPDLSVRIAVSVLFFCLISTPVQREIPTVLSLLEAVPSRLIGLTFSPFSKTFKRFFGGYCTAILIVEIAGTCPSGGHKNSNPGVAFEANAASNCFNGLRTSFFTFLRINLLVPAEAPAFLSRSTWKSARQIFPFRSCSIRA